MWSSCKIKNSDPNIPERRCFNDSQSLDGRELFKRLCLAPSNNNKYRAESRSYDNLSFDQCVRMSMNRK